jgi:hypothetical protein
VADGKKSSPGPKGPGAKRAPRDARTRALIVVEQHIRASGIAPGFDYAGAVAELLTRFSGEEIAAACEAGKSAVEHWRDGSAIPRHDRGERLYILYVETFGKKPPFKTPN